LLRLSYAPQPRRMAVTPRPPQQRRLFQPLSPPWRAMGGGLATTAAVKLIKPPKNLRVVGSGDATATTAAPCGVGL
ncbi:hypothetical protein Tco_0263044, partial [Tanacetum coccineum]